MKARDVMVSPVISVKPSCTVKELAKTLLERRISAVPVVDDSGKLAGIVSEGDLMHRAEIGTQRRHSWWLRVLTGDDALAAEYTKAHARTVADVMTRDVITASPDTPLHEMLLCLKGTPSSGCRSSKIASLSASSAVPISFRPWPATTRTWISSFPTRSFGTVSSRI